MIPEPVKKQWQSLRESPINYGPGFWDLWNEQWQPYFIDLQTLVKKNMGFEMPASDSDLLYKLSKKLTFFIDLLRANKNKFTLNATARDLIAHHIGNGLYLIYLIGNLTENTIEPIPPENVHKIAIAVNDMELFWKDLRAIEKLKKF